MSEEGGLDELEESLRAAASCRGNWATTARRASNSPRKASTSACNRWQLAHGGVVSVVMGAESILPPARIQHCERSLACRTPLVGGGDAGTGRTGVKSRAAGEQGHGLGRPAVVA